jgi:inner membrane protein
MDNLTHTLIGVAIAKAGVSRKWGKGTTAILALSSNLPDVDVLALFFRSDGFMVRRMITHSVFSVPLLTALFAALMALRYRHLGFGRVFGLASLGVGLHMFFDLLNSYGVVCLWPLSYHRFEFAWVFIIDLVIWAILILPFIVALVAKRRGHPAQSERAFQTSLAALTLYVCLCGAGRIRSQQVLNAHLQNEPVTPISTYVFPEALGPHRFKAVAHMGDVQHLYQVRPWSNQVFRMRQYKTKEGTPDFESIKDDPEIRKLIWFFKAPVWNIVRDETVMPPVLRVEVFDLRFISTVISRRSSFQYTFTFPLPEKN